MLEDNTGWNVCCECGNGSDALIKAQQLQPDVIILDMSMPGMSGLTLASQLKKLMPDVSLLMFTAFPTGALKKIALAAGISSVTSKSDATALVQCVNRSLKPAA